MSEAAAFPLMVIFGAFTVLLVRTREIRLWQATLVFLFGLYTALTPVVFTVTGLVQWLISRFTT